MNEKPIGIFDSGIGGLTVAGEVLKQLEGESLIYFGDTARFPYGPRPAEELKGFVFQIAGFLESEGVKMIIIACNSASAAALEEAQKHFSIPIIGVVEPGARAAAQATVSRKIGVIGTQATISSGAYRRAIHAFDMGAEIFDQATPDLADFVEAGKLSGEEVEIKLKGYLKPLLDGGIDTLILGCTHYPLLDKTIHKVAGNGITLINSAKETAMEIGEILKRKGFISSGSSLRRCRFISSGDSDKFLRLGSHFLGGEIETVEHTILG